MNVFGKARILRIPARIPNRRIPNSGDEFRANSGEFRGHNTKFWFAFFRPDFHCFSPLPRFGVDKLTQWR